ncbi:MAG: hypothetical protein RL661_887 [Pseudomonadota bacterium]|jgi:hypothetical protein
MYQLVDNLPVPRATRRLKHGKYPLAAMQPGQAFIIPADNMSKSGIKSVRSYVGAFRRSPDQLGKKFAIRQLEDGNVGVWRVS